MARQRAEKSSKISGTREWAVAEINCSLGCPHNCRYCYARYDAVERKNLLTREQWTTCKPLVSELELQQPRYCGQVMFPSAHDIVPENLEDCLKMLANLLSAGNRVLVVTKPHFEVVDQICATFKEKRPNIVFRFTITARDERLLKFWEPGAPDYEERFSCLKHAFTLGFETSVSVEPMLDSDDLVEMVTELLPFTSHSLWIGKMNKISTRVVGKSPFLEQQIDHILQGQNDQRIRDLYKKLGDNPKIRWKESIKEVLGIALAKQPGLDL